jgi:hypothetical protein
LRVPPPSSAAQVLTSSALSKNSVSVKKKKKKRKKIPFPVTHPTPGFHSISFAQKKKRLHPLACGPAQPIFRIFQTARLYSFH